MRLNKVEILLFLMIFFTYAYFFQGRGGWGTTVRFDFLYSAIDKHTLQIDAYHENTGDKALFDGHFYLDKPIGSVLPAFPAFIIIRFILKLMNIYIANPNNTIVNSLVVTFSVSLISSIMAVFLFRFLNYFAKDVRYSILITLAYSLATIAFPYSTLFHGHQIAAACLFISFYLIFCMKQKNKFKNSTLYASGLLASYSVITEYQTVMIYFGLLVYLFFSLSPKKKIIYFLAASVIPLAIFALFNYLCFKGPLNIGYSYNWYPLNSSIAGTGFMGMESFKLLRLYGLTFSSYRGMFYHSPFLLLSLVAFYFFFKERSLRKEWWLSLYIVIAYFYWFSCYVGWYGGWSFGPRYLIPMLPFLVFPTVFLLNRFNYKSLILSIFRILFLLSFVFILVGTAVNPEDTPHIINNPLKYYGLPSLLLGRISFNLGLLFIGWIPYLNNFYFFSLLTLLPLLVFLAFVYRYLMTSGKNYNFS